MNIAITGGTGSLGNALTERLLRDPSTSRLVILSRDELKQSQMAERFSGAAPLRFFLGDVRDRERLAQAFHGIDAVIHCAALKRIESASYNPSEIRRTNIEGSANVVAAAIGADVAKVIMISTDKACSPTTAYGVSKAHMEHEAIASNAYARGTRISVVRYGNVVGSRGSVVHLFRSMRDAGQPLKITDPRCTRFWLRIEDAVELVLKTLSLMRGGEIVVPVLPSARIVDLAEAIAPGHPTEIVGLRPGGEKFHEVLLNEEEVRRTVALDSVFLVNPSAHPWRAEPPWEGEPLPAEYVYRSDLNGWRLSVEEIGKIVEEIK